jgi:hypothetical protein
MFEQAGFGSVEVFGVFDGYNRQKAVYGMHDARSRRAARKLANPPSSWKGLILRRVSNVSLWSRTLEDEVVVFGRKTFKDGRLTWQALPHAGPVTQFSTGDKVFVLCFDGEPSAVFKGPKTSEAAGLLAREYEFLREAGERAGAGSAGWPLRWPKPLGVQELEGRGFFRYEFARGGLLSGELLPVSFELDRFGGLFTRLVGDYVQLCAKMTAASGIAAGSGVDALLDSLAAAPVGDDARAARIRAACETARRKKWGASWTHGDLSLSNAMLQPEGGIVLIDWENASLSGLVAIDLVRLLNDVLDDSRLLRPNSRRAALDLAKRVVRDALERLGVGPGDYGDVEALFVAHQFRLWLSRDAGAASSSRARELLRRCREREFSPDVSPSRGTPVPEG